MLTSDICVNSSIPARWPVCTTPIILDWHLMFFGLHNLHILCTSLAFHSRGCYAKIARAKWTMLPNEIIVFGQAEVTHKIMNATPIFVARKPANLAGCAPTSKVRIMKVINKVGNIYKDKMLFNCRC